MYLKTPTGIEVPLIEIKTFYLGNKSIEVFRLKKNEGEDDGDFTSIFKIKEDKKDYLTEENYDQLLNYLQGATVYSPEIKAVLNLSLFKTLEWNELTTVTFISNTALELIRLFKEESRILTEDFYIVLELESRNCFKLYKNSTREFTESLQKVSLIHNYRR